MTEQARVLGPERRSVLLRALVESGLYCFECKEPILSGTEYVRIEEPVYVAPPGPGMKEQVFVPERRVALCDRDSCAEARADIARTATASRPVTWEHHAQVLPVDPAQNGDGGG